MEISPLIPIGSKIKVDKSKIENVISEQLLDKLPQIIIGEVIDYKMTDGTDIGYVLITENNLKVWIFSDELNDETKKEYKIEDRKQDISIQTEEFFLGKFNVHYEINGNRKIKTLSNPLNLISWIIFTLKDIF